MVLDLDLDCGLLRLCLSGLELGRGGCLPLLSLGLSLSLLLSFQCPDLGLYQLFVLRGHSGPILAELLLKGGSESLLL